MPLLSLKNITIAYGSHTVVHDFSLELKKGEITSLIGPSGCGKTTILRSIAGFEKLKRGMMTVNHELISDANMTLAPEKRNIGMVFQDFALFPHLNINDNICFGIHHLNRTQQKQRAKELLALIGLSGFEKRYPHELSGGQQQRIALARALAPKPNLLLLDEPFSSMDIELREELAKEVRQILKHENITAILVTHDQNEAFAMADNIAVIKEGELLQWDSAYNLYHQPNSPFVADFIGQGVLIDGLVVDENHIETSLAPLKGLVPNGCDVGCRVKILVRPDDILHDDCSPRKARIVARNFQGANYLYTLELKDGTQLLSLVHSHHDHAIGEELGIVLEIDHLVVFSPICE
ncbi:MAG: ABC transporter ATP-binding protein [Thiotrichaceae bacterium]|nr:ABC transporter ATP-binding protein [Thiotrichaceae bacterium]